MDVCLLSSSANALNLIYTAYKQCYSQSSAREIMLVCNSEDYEHDIKRDWKIDPRTARINFIRNCIASGHVSPLEHVSLSFGISGVSRALTHQLVRHRIASYSHQSQRYVNANGFDYIIPPAIANISEAKELFKEAMTKAGNYYTDIQAILVANGHKKTANEDARFVLPNACETKIVVTMNARSWLHFFEMRCCMRAQWEIRNMANAILNICVKEIPFIFTKAGAPCSGTNICKETKKFSCGMYKTFSELIDEYNEHIG